MYRSTVKQTGKWTFYSTDTVGCYAIWIQNYKALSARILSHIRDKHKGVPIGFQTNLENCMLHACKSQRDKTRLLTTIATVDISIVLKTWGALFVVSITYLVVGKAGGQCNAWIKWLHIAMVIQYTVIHNYTVTVTSPRVHALHTLFHFNVRLTLRIGRNRPHLSEISLPV
jgi:hypothetical protein